MILEIKDSEILLHISSPTHGLKTARTSIEDKDLVLRGRWWVDKGRNGVFYVRGRVDGLLTGLHRAITNCPSGKVVDHIDGEGLNCTRGNLRICSRKENSRNSSPNKGKSFKGVYLPQRGRWVAQIVVDFKSVYLGRHDTKEKALLAYDEAAMKYFGEFARTNKAINGERKWVEV